MDMAVVSNRRYRVDAEVTQPELGDRQVHNVANRNVEVIGKG